MYNDLIYCFVPEATLSLSRHKSRYASSHGAVKRLVDLKSSAFCDLLFSSKIYTTRATQRQLRQVCIAFSLGSGLQPCICLSRAQHGGRTYSLTATTIRIGHPDMMPNMQNSRIAAGRVRNEGDTLIALRNLNWRRQSLQPVDDGSHLRFEPQTGKGGEDRECWHHADASSRCSQHNRRVTF